MGRLALEGAPGRSTEGVTDSNAQAVVAIRNEDIVYVLPAVPQREGLGTPLCIYDGAGLSQPTFPSTHYYEHRALTQATLTHTIDTILGQLYDINATRDRLYKYTEIDPLKL